jgi:hypothetical protein
MLTLMCEALRNDNSFLQTMATMEDLKLGTTQSDCLSGSSKKGRLTRSCSNGPDLR